MKYFIITGTSRGIGEGIAAALLAEGHRVIGLSRNPTQLPGLENHTVDLAQTETLTPMMEEIIGSIDPQTVSGIYLINNAGMLAPVKPLQRANADELLRHNKVNVVAPMVLCADFLRLTNQWATEKRILNMSSGAGKRPFFGWAAYCSSKAAIDMLSRTLALEQTEAAFHPAAVVSFSPGVVDTEMQSEIRNTDPADFVNQPRFVDMKENGDLQDAAIVGRFIADFIQSDAFENGSVLDIRDLID